MKRKSFFPKSESLRKDQDNLRVFSAKLVFLILSVSFIIPRPVCWPLPAPSLAIPASRTPSSRTCICRAETAQEYLKNRLLLEL